MTRHLLKDLSSLTLIKDKIFDKLTSTSELCIGDYLNELDLVGEDVLHINIGIGTISMLVIDDEIQYAFKPSTTLESTIIHTIENKQSPLVTAAEINLDTKITSTFKELI